MIKPSSPPPQKSHIAAQYYFSIGKADYFFRFSLGGNGGIYSGVISNSTSMTSLGNTPKQSAIKAIMLMDVFISALSTRPI